jgi:PPOX class probable F420-dependent enzyme
VTSHVDRLGATRYLLLTTFRKSGAAVPTPVWVGRDNDELLVWSARNTGKVKRLRNSGAVELAECDFHGKPSGPVVRGQARLLDVGDIDRVLRSIRSKYGVLGWLSVYGSVLRRGKKGIVGIAITVSDAEE